MYKTLELMVYCVYPALLETILVTKRHVMVHVVNKLPKKHKLLIVVLVSLIALIALLPSEKATASRDSEKIAIEIGKRYELPMDIKNAVNSKPNNTLNTDTNSIQPHEQYDFIDYNVKSGDSLASIFKRAGFSAQTLHKLVNLNESTKKLTKIHPGEVLSFAKNKEGVLQQLKYILSKTDTLFVTLNDKGIYKTSIHTKKVETISKSSSGKIKSSFWTAGIAAGLTESQIMNFADIFGWDVDFANDIRKDDTFSLIFESHFVEGQEIGNGHILAAEFINQGERYSAIRHSDGNYYTAQGRSMKKAFLRAPVNFKYISSSFNPRRRHPVTKRITKHRGIDYAASTGTPVVSAGKGKVIKSGYNRLNGNYIFIEHGTKYTTKYLHLHKRYVKKGQKVKQGQKIGTVGATGRVTGPHLHYEFLVNGVHKNPKTVKLPKSQPLPKGQLDAFRPIATVMLSRLQRNRELQLAINN
jgi:murein DD-endopeptidase MepM/ murein hydrolase activator NlpD